MGPDFKKRQWKVEQKVENEQLAIKHHIYEKCFVNCLHFFHAFSIFCPPNFYFEQAWVAQLVAHQLAVREIPVQMHAQGKLK